MVGNADWSVDIVLELWYASSFSCSLVLKTFLGVGTSSSLKQQCDTVVPRQIGSFWDWVFKAMWWGRRSVHGRGYLREGRTLRAWRLSLAPLHVLTWPWVTPFSPWCGVFCPYSQGVGLEVLRVCSNPWLRCALCSLRSVLLTSSLSARRGQQGATASCNGWDSLLHLDFGSWGF